MRKVVLASKNQGKVRELQQLLSMVELVSLRDVVHADFEVEETGATFEDNAWLKAVAACKAARLPALADDSGLEVDALQGRPGVHSARYAGPRATDAENNSKLLEELRGVPRAKRTARFRCILALAEPSAGPRESGAALAKSNAALGKPGAEGAAKPGAEPKRVVACEGVVEGHIVDMPRGDQGFGYDPLFEPLDYAGFTSAEISSEQKNAVSHRGQAARALAQRIAQWAGAGD